MRKRILYIFIFITLNIYIGVGNSNAQMDYDTDISDIPAYKLDTTYAIKYLKLAKHETFGNKNDFLAKKYVDTAYAISKKIKYVRGMMMHWNIYGLIARNESRYKDAIMYHNYALDLSRKYKFKYQEALILNNIAVAWRRIDNFSKAIELYLTALPLAEKTNNKKAKLYILNGLGNCYIAIQNYKEALFSFKKALASAKKQDNKESVAINLNNIGEIYELNNDFELAYKSYEESLLVNKSINNKRGISLSYISIGMVKYKEAYYDEALSLFLKALGFEKKLEERIYLARCNIYIAKVYNKLNQTEKALKYINKGYVIANKIQSKNVKKIAYKAYSEVYNKRKEYKKAYEYIIKYIAIKDSIMNADMQSNINGIQIQYEFEKQESKRLAELKKHEYESEKSFRNFIILIVVSVLILVIVVTFLLSRQSRIQQRSNKKLKMIVHEKEVLLAEVHHRVKNNLAIISGLIQLQIQQFNFTKESALNALNDTKNRIHSFALIHENIYNSETNSTLDFEEFLNKQIKRISKTFNNTNIEAKVYTRKLILDLNVAVPLGLIVNELITNAYRHAFPDGRKGKITINFSGNDKKFVLRISDNGIGMPENININKAESAGLLIVSIYARQLNAEIKLSNEGGACFEFSFVPKTMKVWN